MNASGITSTARGNRVYWALADTLTVTWRHLLRLPRVPEQVVSSAAQPVIFVLLFRYIFGGAIETPGVSYVNFLMAGAFVQAVVFEGMGSGISLALDLQQRVVDRFRTLPCSPFAVLAGPIVADVVRNLFVIGMMVLVGLAVGFRPEAGALGWLAAVAVLLATSVAISWVGTLVALIVRDPEAVQATSFIVLVPLAFGSSAFVPVETMPGWLQAVVRYQPISAIVDTVRALLLDQPLGNAAWLAAVWIAAIMLVSAVCSVALFQRRARA